MADPITIDIPHKAGRTAAREKIEKGLAQMAAIVPGGRMTQHHWEGDTVAFTLEAMGQSIASRIEVLDDKVHAVIDLPPMLALFAGKIREKLRDKGTKMLN